MSLQLSVPELLSDLAADGTAITLDMPDGGYDRLHALIEQTGILPTTAKSRVTIIAILLLASRILKQQLGSLGPVTNYIRELGDDAVREEAKRIIEAARSATGARTTADGFWEMDAGDRSRLLELYAGLDDAQRTRLRLYLFKMTALRLGVLSRLSPEHLELVLDLVAPPETPRESLSSIAGRAMGSVNDFFFPWLRNRRGGPT